MNEILGYMLEIVSPLISYLQIDVEITPADKYKKISKAIIILQITYIIVDMATKNFGIYLIFSLLRFLHDYPFIVVAYIGIIAILSPITAYYEHEKCGFPSKKSYIIKNAIFNIAGACAAYAMFFLAHRIIPDFNLLKRFQIESFVSLFISMSVTLVLLYQSTEQNMTKNGMPMDHCTSIRWHNQQINMLHLFNVYFFPLISAVYIVTYTIYCKTYHIPLVMNGSYIAFLVLALLFFYILPFHPHEYLYNIFLIATPAILITSTYWLSWFEKDAHMLYIESGFIVINLILFTLNVLRRTQLSIQPASTKKFKNFIIKWRYILSKNIVSVFIIFIAIVAYLSMAFFPLSTERIPSNEAENYIYAICHDTNCDAMQIIENSHSLDTYDTDDGSYDKLDYMDFLNRELKTEIAAKHIIENGTTLEYNDLETWYKNIPNKNQ